MQVYRDRRHADLLLIQYFHSIRIDTEKCNSRMKCLRVCPTQAIKFGDLDDPESEVSRLIQEKPNFRLLEEAGTSPRVYYVGQHHPGPEIRQIEEITVRV